MSDPIPPSLDPEWTHFARYTIKSTALVQNVFDLHRKRYALVALLRRIIDSRS